MARLATIDEAQKKIDGLTTNVVSCRNCWRQAFARRFGEVQLEGLVRNIMPPQAYAMQYTLPNGTRADCVLKLPEPPAWWRWTPSFAGELSSDVFRRQPGRAHRGERQFKSDIKKHVDDIAGKYIIPTLHRMAR